jgi:hypothetical protein
MAAAFASCSRRGLAACCHIIVRLRPATAFRFLTLVFAFVSSMRCRQVFFAIRPGFIPRGLFLLGGRVSVLSVGWDAA